MLLRRHIEVHGRPTPAVFRSKPHQNTHDGGGGGGRHSFRLVWTVDSYTRIEEYRLLYRQIKPFHPVSGIRICGDHIVRAMLRNLVLTLHAAVRNFAKVSHCFKLASSVPLSCLSILGDPARRSEARGSPHQFINLGGCSGGLDGLTAESGPDRGWHRSLWDGGTGPRSPPAGNLVEAPSAFGMRSYMRNDPAEEGRERR